MGKLAETGFGAFAEECERAGFEVEPYRGRDGRERPAVRCDRDRQVVEVIRATTGKVAWERFEGGYVVYPA